MSKASPKISKLLADLKRLSAAKHEKHKVVIISPEKLANGGDLTGLLDLIGESLQKELGIEEFRCGLQLEDADHFYVRAGKRAQNKYEGKI
jgi:hypothetical protein